MQLQTIPQTMPRNSSTNGADIWSESPGSLNPSCIARWKNISQTEMLLQQQYYEPRSVILREGESANIVFSLISGTAKLSRTLQDGKRQIAGFALPGDLLGNGISSEVIFSVEAINRISVIKLSKSSFLELANSQPGAMKQLYAHTTRELSRTRMHMVLLGRKNANGKLAAFLVDLHDRMFVADDRCADLPIAMTRQDIADYLGLSIETVSRTFSKFCKLRLIEINSTGIRIIDPERLSIIGEI